MSFPADRQTRDKNNYTVVPEADRTIRAVRIIPGVDDAVALASAQSIASDFLSASIDTSDLNSGILTAQWSSANHSDATFVVEISDDETTWQQLGESGTALNADIPSGLQIWQITLFTARYLRLRFTANSNTAGSVDISFAGRS